MNYNPFVWCVWNCHFEKDNDDKYSILSFLSRGYVESHTIKFTSTKIILTTFMVILQALEIIHYHTKTATLCFILEIKSRKYASP